MRDVIKDFIRIVAETLPVAEPIYEFGALQVEGQVGYADLRPYFPGRKYVGADLREGPGVDAILDLHDIELPDESAGAVLALDTLEHVEHPRKAVQEIFRVLKPDGMMVISSVMNFPIHEYPHDFWRFTPDGFKSLIKPFAASWVGWAGEELFPHTVIAVAIKSTAPPEFPDPFTRNMEAWHNQWYFQEGLSPEEVERKKIRKLKKQKKIKHRIKRLLKIE